MTALQIILLIEKLASLAGTLQVEDREATADELEAAGLGSQSALDRLKDEIDRQRGQ